MRREIESSLQIDANLNDVDLLCDKWAVHGAIRYAIAMGHALALRVREFVNLWTRTLYTKTFERKWLSRSEIRTSVFPSTEYVDSMSM
jgi:hypothetical protein